MAGLMAGLVAIVAETEGSRVSPTEVEQLARCYRSLRLEPEYARLKADDLVGTVLFGARGTLTAGLERRGASWAAYVGGLTHGADSLTHAEFATLEGQFALIRYNQDAARIEVLSDPFGLQTFYRARRNGLSYFSTSALALAKHLRARPDVLGLEVSLRTGPHFGELTNWQGIARLSPATAYTYGRGGPCSRVYWQPQVERRITGMTLDAAARECIEATMASLRHRYSNGSGNSAQRLNAWCDLSGGYDTRLIALLLDRTGLRFATNTNGAPSEPDARIARQVAALAGWRWQLGTLGQDWPERCESLCGRAVAWGDGMLEATQLAEVMTYQQARAGDNALLFNGGGGEHWRDYAWKQEIPFGGRRKRVNFDRWVAVRLLHPIEVSIFKVDPTPRVRANLVERCRAYVEPYGDDLNSVSLDMLYAYKAMAHFGAYQSATRGTLHVELPFYAKDAFVTAFSVAPHHRNSHRFARRAIELLDRRIAELPTTHGDLATPVRLRNAHRFLPFYTTRFRGAARKLTQNLPGPTLGAIPLAIPAHVEAARRRVLREFARSTELDPHKMRSGALYDGFALRRLAQSSTAATTGWPTLGRVITAERALEAVDGWID